MYGREMNESRIAAPTYSTIYSKGFMVMHKEQNGLEGEGKGTKEGQGERQSRRNKGAQAGRTR